jgi:dTDP-4-amino-4,6-dideoxygalactose transaminase
MSQHQIPFNRACFGGNESAYIAQTIANGHISGDGVFSEKCQTLLEQELGALKALLTTSCTHALEMVALLIGIEPGDGESGNITMSIFRIGRQSIMFASLLCRPTVNSHTTCSICLCLH